MPQEKIKKPRKPRKDKKQPVVSNPIPAQETLSPVEIKEPAKNGPVTNSVIIPKPAEPVKPIFVEKPVKTEVQAKPVVSGTFVSPEPIIPPVIIEKQKRVGFFWFNLPWHTGARVHDYQIILSLAKAGVKVVSITNSIPSFIRDYPSHKNIEWVVNQHFDPAKIGKLDLAIASSGPWVVKAFGIAKQQNCPAWIFAYGPEKWFFDTMQEPLPDEHVLASRYKEAELIIVSSDLARGKFVEWIPSVEMKLETVKPYINSVHFPKEQIKPLVPTLTYCGRLGNAEYKGCKEFLRWGGEFRKRFCPELELNLIANGSIDEKSRWTVKFNAYDGISEAEKFKVMSRSTAGFVPSKFETFGLVPAEFLALGIPVIAFDNEQFQSEYGDSLIYVRDDVSFFKAMNEVISGQTIPVKLKNAKLNELSEIRMDRQIKNLLQRRIPQWKIN